MECCSAQLPTPTASVHIENELDINMRGYRQTQLLNIATEARKLRDSATDITEALITIEGFIAGLKNFAVEVHLSTSSLTLLEFCSGQSGVYAGEIH
jgi:hypothetical protein